MDVTVCMKYTPTAGYQITNLNEKVSFSAADMCALQMASFLKIKYGVSINVVSMGPLSAKKDLQKLFTYGVDNIYLLSDTLFAGSDTLATSYVLYHALKKIKHDCVLCGNRTDDSSTGQVGPELACLLRYPYLQDINEIQTGLNNALISNTLGTIEVSTPFLASVRTYHLETFIPLEILVNSNEKSVTVWDKKTLGIDTERCGNNGSPTEIFKIEFEQVVMPSRKQIKGDISQCVEQLIKIINNADKPCANDLIKPVR